MTDEQLNKIVDATEALHEKFLFRAGFLPELAWNLTLRLAPTITANVLTEGYSK